MGKVFDDLVTVGIAIIGLAILAVVLKKGSTTVQIIDGLSSTIATSIKAAVGPATGA